MSPDDVVLVAGDWRVTRRQYASRLARAITVLRDLGLGEGGCIGVALRNCPQFFELFAAAGLMGAKSVPVAWRLKREEVAYLIADSGAQAVFYDADSAAQMAGLPGAIPLDDYETRLECAKPEPGSTAPHSSSPWSSIHRVPPAAPRRSNAASRRPRRWSG
jgi:long-chain acyl-CoA synthetase